MRALRHQVTGKPLEVLKLVDLPDPEPGAGEVRVRMTHRPINPSDLHTVLGRYGRETVVPATPGHEGVGVVDAVGDSVSTVSVGDRVVPMGVIGTWQEFVIVSEDRCFVVPEDVPDDACRVRFLALEADEIEQQRMSAEHQADGSLVLRGALECRERFVLEWAN